MDADAVTSIDVGAGTDTERQDRILAERYAKDRGYKIIIYRCRNPKCKDRRNGGERAEDRMVFSNDDVTPDLPGGDVVSFINCYNCHLGYRLKKEVMIQEGKGMCAIRREDEHGNVVAMLTGSGAWEYMPAPAAAPAPGLKEASR